MTMPVERRRFGHEKHRVSTAVIEAVAEYAECDPDELPPLYNTVDPDALDRLFESKGGLAPREGGTVGFNYAGYRVRIEVGRAIDVTVSGSSA